MNDKVLCKDCKHSFRTWYDILFMSSKRYSMKCRKSYKPAEDEEDLVLGPKFVPEHYESCGQTRIRSSGCGPEGKWWQPKDPKKLFFYIKRST